MPAMTPLSMRLNRALRMLLGSCERKRTPNSPYIAKSALNARIELVPSRMSHAVRLGIAVLTLIVPINSQIPAQFIGIIWIWVIASVIQAYRNPQSITEIRDEGKTWLLVSPSSAIRVRFKNTDYRSTYVIVITFVAQNGSIHRVCIWRDAVTHSAFSWISARITLGSPDRPVKTMATSEPRTFFHSRRG